MAISKIQSDSITDSAVTSDKISGGAIGVSDLGTQVQGALGTRNLIINGDMRIAQRGTSVSGITSSNYYTVDRFKVATSLAGTWTMTQDTDVPSGQGFTNSTKLSCTTANGSLSAGSNHILFQTIEAQNLQHIKFGTPSAEPLTLSFWVKSNKTGTYTAELYLQDDARQNSQTFTITTADTWEKKTITVDGDTVGVIDNDNGAGISLFIWLVSGTTWTSGTLNTSWNTAVTVNRVSSSNVNLADSTSNYINITGVQLEIGDTATPFEHRPYDMELLRCKRYFYIVDGGQPSANNTAIGSGYNISTTSGRIAIAYPVEMRTTPTFSYTGTIYLTNSGGNGITITSISASYANQVTAMLNFTVASGLTQGYGTLAITNNGSGQTFQASAEL